MGRRSKFKLHSVAPSLGRMHVQWHPASAPQLSILHRIFVSKVSTGAVQGDVEYRDGAHVWVSIPRLDMYDYHPLSVTSSPCFPEWRRTMLLQCKVYDKWTQARLPPLHLVRLTIAEHASGVCAVEEKSS
jgi:hypothetical protein